MSLALSGDTVAYLMGLGLDAEQMKGLIDRLHRDAAAVAPPTTSNGINEERERLRNESTYAERKRAKDRERQRLLREEARRAREAEQSRDIDGDPAINRATSTATEGDRGAIYRDAEPSRTGARVVNPFSSSFQSEEVGVGGVEREREIHPPEDWPAGNTRDHAKLIVAHVASPWLDPMKSPDLVTTAGRISSWRRDGASWEHDVLPVIAGLCANRRSRVATWKFFDDAIARSIADNRAALEIPEAGRAHRSTGPPQSFAQTIAAESAEARRRVLES